MSQLTWLAGGLNGIDEAPKQSCESEAPDLPCRENLEYFARFVREHRSELATILWKDTSPQHFDYENGYFW